MKPIRAVTTSAIIALCILSLGSSARATELRDVLAHPKRYEGQRLELIGIARTYQGWFHLYADPSAAAKSDLSKGLLVRQNNFAGLAFREFDRQWVRVTGVMSWVPRRGYDPGMGILLEHVQMVLDRPPPHIKNPYVLGVFCNATNQPVTIRLQSGWHTQFWLGPHEADKIEIFEGGVVASQLIGPANQPLDQRRECRLVAKGALKFRHLLALDYEYSPEWSDKRTFYYKIAGGDIKRVPAIEGKKWKIIGGKPPPRSNQTMQPTARRRTASLSMTNKLSFQTSLAVTSGG